MDKIWIETRARLDALEKRCIEFYLQHPDLPAIGEPQPNPQGVFALCDQKLFKSLRRIGAPVETDSERRSGA